MYNCEVEGKFYSVYDIFKNVNTVMKNEEGISVQPPESALCKFYPT